MRYINPRFTYLLTYLLTYCHYVQRLYLPEGQRVHHCARNEMQVFVDSRLYLTDVTSFTTHFVRELK